MAAARGSDLQSPRPSAGAERNRGGLCEALSTGGLGGIDLPPIDVSASLGLPAGTVVLTINTDEVVGAPGVTVINSHL
ncbi:MAG: hypothetical protein K0V04_08825 [Deltaproteobacteria bacterium]|nr:hypothetical protein [Deltaproteobacteria bacterium]